MVQFFRKTEVVNDTGLFQVYPDLFVGQDTTMEVKGGTASRRAVMEFKIADAPTFGDAQLTAVRPNFYINSVNLNDSTELPRFKGYVFNTHLSDLTSAEGGLSIDDESLVIVNSFMSNDGSWVEEKFDGAPRQIGGNVPELKVENGTVIREVERAISVDNLISWLRSDGITGGDGGSIKTGIGFLDAALDEAEYSDDFDEYLEQSDRALKNWLCTNYGMQTDNIQGIGTRAESGFGIMQSIRGATGGAATGAMIGGGAGAAVGAFAFGAGALPGYAVGATAGAIVGAGNSNPDHYHRESGLFNDSQEGYIVPLRHEKRRAKKDYYRPKKEGNGPSWWIHSKDIDRSGYLIKDLKIERSVESAIDVKSMIHPGNSIFDMVRRQKSYWIADPEDYNNDIEAAYTRSFFTSAAGLDGQAAQLETHWRYIDSAEVSDKAKMVPVAAEPQIDNRQELVMSYGHIPRPNEKDVYHAGAFDVYPEGMSKANDDHDGYDTVDQASRNTLIYEKLLDSKVATKVSFTVNMQDLEYAWAEPAISSTASIKPEDSTDGFISSRRGFFCTLSRNAVKQSEAGQRAQTFTDYLIDNMAQVVDYNTEQTNRPGTFVLGFLNFPEDSTVSTTPHASDATGYIHKERQNKISVVWSDYWTANYATGTNTQCVGWKVSSAGNPVYQGHTGLGSNDFYDIQWMGLTNAAEDQPTNDLVLLDPDAWYTIDMYMHPKVPCIRVHITDVGTGKRVDGNNILMFCGPSATGTGTEGIRQGDGYAATSNLGDESRWPAYCTFWLNNTHWKTTNDSASAFAGYDISGTTNDATDGNADICNHIDIFTGGAAIDGINTHSTVLLDNFAIFNANTAKTYGTISKNCPKGALSRLNTSSYSEVEGLFKPLHYYFDSSGDDNTYSYIQEIDADAAEYSGDGLSSINVGYGGAGYTGAVPEVIIAGTGSGATATATVVGGEITAVQVDTPGSGYTYPPTISFYGGTPTSNAYATSTIGTTSTTKEIVKKIPAPRYTSIGFDDKPSDMYVLYGNVEASGSTTTKVMGGTDYSSTSMMSFGASGSVTVTKVHGAGSVTSTQTNPQTAEFSSTTDNELIGGKLKIHYSDMRAGDAGCQTAVRDIVRAYNAASGPYVEVWPPLPLQPDAADEWEIQSRGNILFNDLVTREINDVTQMLGVPYAYARPGFDLDDDTATPRPSRGVFNLGWDHTCSDITSLSGTAATTVRTITGSGSTTHFAAAPHGTIKGGWNDDSTPNLLKIGSKSSQDAPNNSSTVLRCVKNYDGGSSIPNPSGFRRTFTNPVDLTNCDIMVIVKVPSTTDDASAVQIDGEGETANPQLEILYGVGPTGGGGTSEQRARGPEFAASLRLGHKIADGTTEYIPNSYGAFCAHKNLFMKGDEASVYSRAISGTLNAKTAANDRWVKLVFPTADYNIKDSGTSTGMKTSVSGQKAYMQAITEIEFGVGFSKSGANTSGAEDNGIIYVAGVYAIPRNVGDVMAGFSNSQNAVGEISKETFLPVDHALPAMALDGVKHVDSGLYTGLTNDTKIAGLTVGGKDKLYTGYRTAEGGTLSNSDTTLTIDNMTGDQYGLRVDDRIMLGNNAEIIRISAVTNATTLTIERGVDGSTAETHGDDSLIYVLTPSDAEVIIKDYDYDVEGFSQKGFVNFGFDGNSGNRYNDSITWEKRENPLVATRVIEVVGHTEQGIQVRVDQPDLFQCENDSNTTWALYSEATRRIVSDGNNTGERTTFTFNRKQLNGDILTLPRTDFFKSLPDDTSVYAPRQNIWISPYKYWMFIRYLPRMKGNSGYCVADYNKHKSPDIINFPKRSYKSLVKTSNRHKGASSTMNIAGSSASHYSLSKKDVGPTWKESNFTDGKYLNSWNLDYAALRPVFEQGKDYGFGVRATEEPEKGHCFEDNALVGWAEKILPSVVQNNNLQPGNKVSFMIAPQDSSQRYSFSINSQENSSNTPYLLTTYFDGLPFIGDFKVVPDETNPMFPMFSWQVSASDVWYGFLKVGTDAIYDQYHNKELHIPLNEETTATLTVNDSTTNVTPSNLTMTREGLAGYAVDFNGGTSYLRYGTGSADPTANCTTYMSVVAHIVPDSGSDNRYIISQEGTDVEKFYIRLNSSNQVEARVWYSDDGYVDLTSGAIVPTDGYTPSVIILTADTTAREGNIKLYVNGKMEDQTGLVDATGTTDNWKTSTTLNSGNGYLYVGNSGAAQTHAFDGRIEEIVVYKDLIYPVDVKGGKYTLTKPLKELNTNGKRQAYSCVLFVKDYHNIRGKKPEDVARTESLTFSKSSPAVTGG